MVDVVVFHHALGLTDGVVAFADALRDAGHTVETPDLFDGRTFGTVEEGVAHVGEIGWDQPFVRGEAAVEGREDPYAVVGFSLGVMPAQKLAQTRSSVLGAVLCHAAIPVDEFGVPWPEGKPLQLHVMEDDELGDVPEVRELGRTIPTAAMFLYPGDGHLFTDPGSDAYEEGAARLVIDRTLRFLADLDA